MLLALVLACFDPQGEGDKYSEGDTSADGDDPPDTDVPDTPVDADSDGYTDDVDCDDDNATIHPGAADVCDPADLDEDCNGVADNDDDMAMGMAVYYTDADGDGLGDAQARVIECDEAPGVVADTSDCDDGDPAVGAATPWYRDGDRDGFGDPDVSEVACDAPSADYVAAGTDCDDRDASVNPDGAEICAAGDEDCDGLEGDADPSVSLSTASTWYTDGDGDGYGEDGEGTVACEVAGAAASAGDCDDGEPLASPGLDEICDDGIDNDCDGGSNDCGVASATLASTSAEAMILGLSSNCESGNTLDFTDDWDGDGYDDLVGSCKGYDWASGVMHVVSGGVTGTTYFTSGASFLPSLSDYDDFGWSVAGAGDIDGDGDPDVVGGAPYYGGGGGAAFLYYGPSASSYVRIFGDSSRDYCGYVVGGRGDASGDGRDDFLISCGGEDTVYLVATSPTSHSYASSFYTVSTETGGNPVAIVDDLDGDGIDDVLLGAWNAAYVLPGPVTGDVEASSAGTTLTGTGYFGYDAAGLGDTDGDGYGDIAVLAPAVASGASTVSEVTVYTGSAAGIDDAPAATLTGDGSTAYTENSLAGAGDVDGDGYADLLAGLSDYDTGGVTYGAAFLVHGPFADGDLDADVLLRGGASTDQAGFAVAGGGDWDGDGVADIAVGAPQQDSGGSNAGAAYVLLGGGL